MKIVNRTYRDQGPGESTIQKTPITDLSPTTELQSGSLLHIVSKTGSGDYESHKMDIDDFKQKIYDSVQNTFKTKYWDTHESYSREIGPSSKHNLPEEDTITTSPGTRPEGTSFAALVDYLETKNAAPSEIPDIDPDGFVDHIYYDFDVLKRYVVLKDGDIERDISNLNDRVDELDCYFAPAMRFATTMLDNNMEVAVTSDSLNHDLTENDTYCQMHIESGNKISNEWTCPESGNLVIYGWLDSSECLNNKATPSAFCVIEAKINTNWEVISACPVTPAKSITYVGFNLLVKKDLVIRARTGFVCGAKSGQFPNQQDGYDTLANNTVNGFKCMIYYKDNTLEGTDA